MIGHVGISIKLKLKKKKQVAERFGMQDLFAHLCSKLCDNSILPSILSCLDHHNMQYISLERDPKEEQPQEFKRGS